MRKILLLAAILIGYCTINAQSVPLYVANHNPFPIVVMAWSGPNSWTLNNTSFVPVPPNDYVAIPPPTGSSPTDSWVRLFVTDNVVAPFWPFNVGAGLFYNDSGCLTFPTPPNTLWGTPPQCFWTCNSVEVLY